MKKILALTLALVMLAAFGITALAEGETYTVSVTNSATGYTYEAYQIFKGDLNENTLSNIEWGDNISAEGKTALGDAAAYAETLTDTNAAEEAGVLAGYLAGAAKATATAPNEDGKYVLSGLEPGYYLIKNTAVPTNGAYSSYMLQVVKSVDIEPKSALPTVDKQVSDETAENTVTNENSSAIANGSGWYETADHDIGETFQFKLIATLPNESDLNAYDSYKLVFHDTMSAGITFEQIDSVTTTNSNGTPIVYSASAINNGSWTLTIDDLTDYVTALPGTVVTVTYSVHLNEDAAIGNATPRNENTVYLEYSNNPNWNGEGDTPTGTTPEDHVWVFTYEMKNTKVDGNDAPLGGATFVLKRSDGKYYGGVGTDGNVSWVELAEGETVLVNGAVREGIEAKVSDSADGDFSFVGLDAGTYTLQEVITPAGYNTCADVEVVISAGHTEGENTDGSTTVTNITMTKDGTAADEITVVNQAGSTLPTTGGIGTTIFYIIGAVLVIGAGILLVTKKRMNGVQE